MDNAQHRSAGGPGHSHEAHLESWLGADALNGAPEAFGAQVLLALSDGACAAHCRCCAQPPESSTSTDVLVAVQTVQIILINMKNAKTGAEWMSTITHSHVIEPFVIKGYQGFVDSLFKFCLNAIAYHITTGSGTSIARSDVARPLNHQTTCFTAVATRAAQELRSRGTFGSLCKL